MLNKKLILKHLYYCLTDLIESSVLPPSEPLGHVIIREQLSTKYHQENDCNLIGPPEEISSIESNKLSADCSAQVLSERKTVVESQVSGTTNHSKSLLETCESLLHKEDFQGDESLLNYSEAQDRADPQITFNICTLPLAQYADNMPHSPQENRINVEDNSIEINITEELHQSQMLQKDTPCENNSTSFLFTDPLVSDHIGVTHSEEEKNDSIVKPCESVALMLQSSTDNKNETPDLKFQQTWVHTETVDSGTSLVFSVDDADACNPLQSMASVDSHVPTTVIISEESDQAQESTTNSTQVAPLLGLCGNCSPLDVNDNLSNNSNILSSPSASPLDAPTLNELPQFTNQRPPNLPSATGKRSPITSWNISPLPTSPLRYDGVVSVCMS